MPLRTPQDKRSGIAFYKRMPGYTRNGIAVFSILILSVLFSVATAQNLVSNGGFEDYNCIPIAVAKWNCAKDWFPANAGSPDYYHRDAGAIVGVPKNNIGTQEPHDGAAYAGIIVLDQYEGIVEYFETKLMKPLVKGDKYYFSMYVSLAEKSKFGINSLGAYFSTDKQQRGKWEGIYVTPQVLNDPDSVIYDTRRWHKIAGYIIAAGGEQYLTIGNFTKEDVLKRQQINDDGLQDVVSYYYLDDVSLTAIKPPAPIPVVIKDTLIKRPLLAPDPKKLFVDAAVMKPGDVFKLKNIYFDFDENTLLPASFDELNKLLELLQKNPTMRIELRGHTDNRGDNAHNSRLSALRARAVVEYLTSKGINANRLHYKGFGSRLPYTGNNTEKGRSQNRRVEFVILKR